MPFDSEIWCPCRLGEPFRLYDLGYERTAWLQTVRADWQGGRGDFSAVSSPMALMKKEVYQERVGIGPRPWSNCWTCEAKIRITPPTNIWEWNGVDARELGLELPPMKNGRPRKASLMWVGIRYGVPGYCVAIEGRGRIWLDTLPALQNYFAPIWAEHHLLARRRYAYTYAWSDNQKKENAK